MIRKAILPLILSGLFVACTPNAKRDIEAAAQGYLDAAGNYHLDEAAAYASKNTREASIPALKKMMAKADTAYINANQPADITIQSTRMINDSTAKVYYHKHTPIKDVDDSILVIYEEQRWVVDVTLMLPSILLFDSIPSPFTKENLRNPEDSPLRKLVSHSKRSDLLPKDTANLIKMHQKGANPPSK